MMTNITRKIVLDTLIKHETLIIDDLKKEENLGLIPDMDHLNYLLSDLLESGDVVTLNGVEPVTYTITTKGIAEGKRINETI